MRRQLHDVRLLSPMQLANWKACLDILWHPANTGIHNHLWARECSQVALPGVDAALLQRGPHLPLRNAPEEAARTLKAVARALRWPLHA